VIGAYLGKGGDVVNAGREVMLRLEDVQTFYGPIQALKGISLEVREGEIVTLIGANGAGKSTTLRSINGLKPPRKGKIHFQEAVDARRAFDGACPGLRREDLRDPRPDQRAGNHGPARRAERADGALDAADRGYVLETGRIALADDAKKLRENEQVQKTYLGIER
jgi:ABC-type branched-subunit amino acid transport system ATPase component